MRVLVLAPDQLMHRSGGLRTQVVRTSESLRDIGVNVDFYNHWEDTDLKKFDLAHVYSMNSPTYFKALSLKGKLPLVFSSVMWRNGSRAKIRALVEMGIRSPYQVLNDTICCRVMSEWAEKILPNTVAESIWLESAIGVDRNKCVVVPNGADNNFLNKSDDYLEENSSWISNEEFVLCVSVLSSRKNLVALAEVCRDSGYPLVVAGPIVDRPVYDKLMSMSASGMSITMLGNLDNGSDTLGYLYRKCRVFCLPSFYETPGIAALEAGLQGARVVVTKVGGADEYFGEMASYIDPYSKADLRNKIETAWNLGRNVGEGQMLHRHLMSEFSWASVAKKTLAAYESVLSKGTLCA